MKRRKKLVIYCIVVIWNKNHYKTPKTPMQLEHNKTEDRKLQVVTFISPLSMKDPENDDQ